MFPRKQVTFVQLGLEDRLAVEPNAQNIAQDLVGNQGGRLTLGDAELAHVADQSP